MQMHFVGFYVCWNGKKCNLSIETSSIHYSPNWILFCFLLSSQMYNFFFLFFNVFSFLLYSNDFVDFQKEMSTQVFILCDKPTDANLILVSFRGTEPFDADDWSTDFDYSWYEIPELGKVHMGFLEALGLGNRAEVVTFQNHLLQVKKTKSPHSEGTKSLSSNSDLRQEGRSLDQSSGSGESSITGGKMIPPEMVEKSAYYVVRSNLKSLLEEHKNAKFVVTGHSLGGALAILFPTVLVLHEETEMMDRLLGIYTFGQPRIGNGQLGGFMENHLGYPVPKYFRVVYCNDLVPRLPYDDKTFLYKHFGVCLYYDSLYNEQVCIYIFQFMPSLFLFLFLNFMQFLSKPSFI